jgi:uncharacterized membrane protein
MKALQKLLLTLAGILIAFVLVGFLLPSKWEVQRTIVIQAPMSTIRLYTNDLKRWPEWTPWNTTTDPTIRFAYTGAESGTGATSTWSSEKSGSGSMTITRTGPNGSIWFDLRFVGSDLPSKGSIRFTPLPDATMVTWTNSGELGSNPVNRCFGLLMNSLMSSDFDKGLLKLKKLIETPH